MTTENGQPYYPLTARQKIGLAARESFDWPMFLLNGGVTFLYLEQKKDPSYGTGPKGYAKEYAAVNGDQIISSMLDDGFVPALLHEDPRYFRLGEGGFGTRLLFSVEQTFITRTDENKKRFAAGYWIANIGAVEISNLYHHGDHSLGTETKQLVFSVGEDTVTNVLEEFWPDMKRRFFHRHKP